MTTGEFFAYLNRSAVSRELGCELAQALERRAAVRRLDRDAAGSRAA
jgi:hypothetical protein